MLLSKDTPSRVRARSSFNDHQFPDALFQLQYAQPFQLFQYQDALFHLRYAQLLQHLAYQEALFRLQDDLFVSSQIQRPPP